MRVTRIQVLHNLIHYINHMMKVIFYFDSCFAI
jgi:hypothetical protein